MRANVASDLFLAVTVLGSAMSTGEFLCRRAEGPRAIEVSRALVGADQSNSTDLDRLGPDSGVWPNAATFPAIGSGRPQVEVKPEGTRRIVCLGDDLTLGYGRPPGQSLPHHLQALLDERGPGVEVLAVALAGGAEPEESFGYERIAKPYPPDLVLLAIAANDIRQVVRDRGRSASWLGWLAERSALVRRALATERPATGRLIDEVGRLRAGVESGGADLILLIVAGPEPYVAPQRTVEGFCAQKGIRCLDLTSDQGGARAARAIVESGVIPRGWASADAAARFLGRSIPLEPRPSDAPRLTTALRAADRALRFEAAWALGRIGPEAAASGSALAFRLGDPDERVRREAAVALGRLRDTAARAALFDSVADSRPGVRRAAARALMAIGLEGADSPALVAVLASPDPYIRAFAAWELGTLGTRAAWAAPSLARRLQDVTLEVRSIATTAITRLRATDPAVVAALGQSLRDTSWPGRWQAARALAALGPASASAAPDLAAALEDGDERVRREAAWALRRVMSSSAAALPVLDVARR